MRTPRLADVVLVVGAPARANGVDHAPAVITRVWGEHPDGGWTVNLTVFPDARLPGPATSVRLVGSEEEARALLPSTAAWRPHPAAAVDETAAPARRRTAGRAAA